MKINTKKSIIIIVIGLLAFLGLGWWVYKRTAGDFTKKLFTAISKDDVEEAKRMIDRGADVNAKRGSKRLSTPLAKAIEEGSPEMVALLLSKGASVEKSFDWDRSPLTQSISIADGGSSIMSSAPRIPWKEVRQNQRKIIPLLVAANAPTEYPPIIPAVLSGNLDLVKQLTQQAKEALKTGEINQKDLLKAAIYSMDRTIIDYVINSIVGKNAIGKTGDLLQWAISSDDPDIINCMLKHPLTDINAYDGAYYPLHYAVMYPIEDKGNPEVVQKLLEMGANPNVQDFAGNTPLHIAVSWGTREPIVQLLLSHGADLTIKNNDGESVEDLLEKNNTK